MSEYKRHSFDAYCKKLLRNAAANAHKSRKRRAARIIPFSGLSEREKGQLAYYDDYGLDKRVYLIHGREVEIRDEGLHRALEQLTPSQRDILFLSCCFELTDAEIAGLLSLPRSTVQYRRTAAINYIRKIMEEQNDCNNL